MEPPEVLVKAKGKRQKAKGKEGLWESGVI
jgi:hypothetical protein